MKYDYKAVEAKWQKVWEDEKTFHVEIDHKKPKFYALVEFPYPSGAGLHVGHPRSYTALDVVSRKRRQNGYNVLYPMGWDAFGLPTENFAMKNHIHPAIVTKSNVDHFRSQLKALGFSFDWDREINTTDPEYYKWTQWIFLQLYKHGLAYKKEMNVNWCTGCKCVLANEEVVNGVCERCGSEVVHKVKSQWMLKITAYADKLIDGLDGLDYIERVATQQKNWIGRSHGAEVNFGTTAGDTLTVYTTRCDTLFGATYMVVSPEHAMVKEWLEKGLLKNADAVTAYQAEAARKSDFERSELNKEKTGVQLEGVRGINPVNDKEIPIFISDYVLYLRHRCHHGRACPRYPRLGVRQKVWPAHHRGRQGQHPLQPRRGCLHRRGHRYAGQLRLPRRPVCHRRQEKDDRVAGSQRQGPR